MKDGLLKYTVTLGLITAVSAAILGFTYEITEKPIAEEYRKDFLRGLVKILPEFNNNPDEETVESGGYTVYTAKYDGHTVGRAVQTSSMKGYGGEISVLVGTGTNGGISGVTIIKHSETPGLGDKITRDEWLSGFIGGSLDTVYAVTADGGDIDQFSGATISPRAVCEAITTAAAILKDVE